MKWDWIGAALLVAAGCNGGAELSSERVDPPLDPETEETAITRSELLRSERAVAEVDTWIAEHPEDAPLREALIQWEAEQLVLDDIVEGTFGATRYGFGEEGL